MYQMKNGWQCIPYYLSPPRRPLRLSQEGSEMQHLIHSTCQAYTSSIHCQPSGTFSLFDTSSSLCSSIVGGDPSPTCVSYCQGTHLGRTRSGFLTFTSLPDLYALSKCGVRLPDLHFLVGVEWSWVRASWWAPPYLRWRQGLSFPTSAPWHKARVKFLGLPASIKVGVEFLNLLVFSKGKGRASQSPCLGRRQVCISFLITWSPIRGVCISLF